MAAFGDGQHARPGMRPGSAPGSPRAARSPRRAAAPVETARSRGAATVRRRAPSSRPAPGGRPASSAGGRKLGESRRSSPAVRASRMTVLPRANPPRRASSSASGRCRSPRNAGEASPPLPSLLPTRTAKRAAFAWCASQKQATKASRVTKRLDRLASRHRAAGITARSCAEAPIPSGTAGAEGDMPPGGRRPPPARLGLFFNSRATSRSGRRPPRSARTPRSSSAITLPGNVTGPVASTGAGREAPGLARRSSPKAR